MRAIMVLGMTLLAACTGTAVQAQYGPGYPPAGPMQPPQSVSHAMLDGHNAIRARVGVPPLAWSPELANSAQAWANQLIATGSFQHQPANRYGENLYSISGATSSPAQAASLWASEARNYDVRRNTCTGICGHYTQIVWRDTRAVGCAEASNGYRQVWVCEYDPPGNVIGYRPY